MRTVSFQAVAGIYDSLAEVVFGTSIKDAQRVYLDTIPEDSRVLVIGGGTGWILKDLLRTGRCRSITFVETAPAMLTKAKRVVDGIDENKTKIDFIQGSVSSLQPLKRYETVLVFFLLDLYSDKEAMQIMQEISAHLEPNGICLFADFDPKSQRYIPYWQKFLLELMFHFFSLTTNLKNKKLPQYSRIFEEAGFTCIQSCLFYGSFIRSSVYQKLSP